MSSPAANSASCAPPCLIAPETEAQWFRENIRPHERELRATTPERSTPVSTYALSSWTEVGEIRNVALPDGSTIQLNTDSAVELEFDADERGGHADVHRGEGE